MKGKKIFKVLSLITFIILISSIYPLFSYGQEKYPSRGVEIILPWAPGGAVDVAGRIFADGLTKVLNVPVTCTNKPGASGTLGATLTMKAKKDGYTLMVNSISGMILAPFILLDIPYDTLKDFYSVSLITITPNAMLVKKDSIYKSLDDVVEAAKKNPGKLTYGTAGVGSNNHLNIELFKIAAKLDIVHVPFKSGGEVLTNVLGGHVDFGDATLSGVASQIKGGAVRALAMTGNKRAPDFPDVPTYAEKGYPQPYFDNWTGIFAPQGIPQSVLNILLPAVEKTIKDPEVIKKIEGMGSAVQFTTPAEFRKFLEGELKTASSLIKNLGLTPKK